MIRSMTGYGREQRIIDQREITVEIKSVNHRYYEFTARVPRIYGFIEEKLKSYIKDSISRGKVEVNVTINNLNGKEANINVDKLMAAGYINALKIANSELNLTDDITLSTLIKFSDIFNVQKVAEDEEIVRLKSHMKQFRELLETDEPVGRKLDFLVQEINREINTIGSKAQNLEITKCVVNMKSESEKIREQIQNIE